jgi:hypothetical protein
VYTFSNAVDHTIAGNRWWINSLYRLAALYKSFTTEHTEITEREERIKSYSRKTSDIAFMMNKNLCELCVLPWHRPPGQVCGEIPTIRGSLESINIGEPE